MALRRGDWAYCQTAASGVPLAASGGGCRVQPFDGGQASCADPERDLVEMLGGDVAADVLRRW